MANNSNASFTLAVKDNRYKGETYTQMVGSFEDGSNTYLVSINTDENGNIPMYKSEKGVHFCYARVVRFKKSPDGKRKRKNQL